MALLGYAWLAAMLRRARRRGETFVARADDPSVRRDNLPAPWRALICPILVLSVSFALPDRLHTPALILASLAGELRLISWCWLPLQSPSKAIADDIIEQIRRDAARVRACHYV